MSFRTRGSAHVAESLAESLEAAQAAGLRYVNDQEPGILRKRAGRGFCYVGPDQRPVRDPKELERIRSLVIPPAWSRVWICASRRGHIQAVGWDAKGRKQYRYHAQYRTFRDQNKFGRMIAFGAVRAMVRKRVSRDLRRTGMPRERVLAAVVRLLETTFIRVGNTEYERENGSFGLTTLRNRHVKVSGEAVEFQFKGKSGMRHVVQLSDRTLARIIRQCQELPGHRLFQYVNDKGELCSVESGDVNDYLRQITGQDFTAKDFRTWAGTVLAARELAELGPFRNKKDEKSKTCEAIKRVAHRLGNRPATCRKYYIHPVVLEAYTDGSLFGVMQQGVEQHQAYDGKGLEPEEYAVMVLMAKHLEQTAKVATAKAA